MARFRSSAPSTPAVLGGQSGQPLKGPELSNMCENVEGGEKKKKTVSGKLAAELKR